ncbi:flagellar motor protein MotP [Salimicrobium halophilum]|uniref:Chemotaxis protein MotA n=1 Tax=Salimicrobium halophilum TaxID=86666 RepID=A0A1G8VJU0_9BACI|nr:flagellar motor protein MotP [Salimicrobium halophilum]SDJ66342.1 chemotaxis protein MotA [Salimicrobium halophilum]
MSRRDILTPIGITLGFIMIMAGIMFNGGVGGIRSFIQATSVFIVLGGTIAALLVNFNMIELKLAYRAVKVSFSKDSMELPDLIRLFVKLSERARREGLLALEAEVDELEDPFIKKGILLSVDGIEPEVINDIMSAEVSAVEERHQRGRAIVEKAGEYSPAWGMIGTLIGLILMLEDLNDPATLGPQMAVALLTTLYGTFLANLVFLPMAGKLANKTDQEIFKKQVVIEGVIGVQSGQNPKILEEKLSAFLSDEEKERLTEVEEEQVEEKEEANEA